MLHFSLINLEAFKKTTTGEMPKVHPEVWGRGFTISFHNHNVQIMEADPAERHNF